LQASLKYVNWPGTRAVTSDHRTALAALATAALIGVFAATAQAAGREEFCDVRLTVELDPGVPNVSNDGFLSSLLNRHFNYRLELMEQDDQDPSVVELRLSGPGPEYRCLSVIETMRRDARVQSIRIESTQLASRS
jgi:hypothetical protein